MAVNFGENRKLQPDLLVVSTDRPVLANDRAQNIEAQGDATAVHAERELKRLQGRAWSCTNSRNETRSSDSTDMVRFFGHQGLNARYQ